MLIQTPLKLLFLHFRHRHCTFSCHCFCSSFLSSLRALCLPIQFFAGTQREGEAPTGLVHLIVGGSIMKGVVFIGGSDRLGNGLGVTGALSEEEILVLEGSSVLRCVGKG